MRNRSAGKGKYESMEVQVDVYLHQKTIKKASTCFAVRKLDDFADAKSTIKRLVEGFATAKPTIYH